MIRRARRDDYDAVSKITYDAFRFVHSRRFFEQKVDGGRLYVYVCNGEVVGIIDVIVDYEPDSVYVAFLAVKKEYRGRGIGKSLMNFAEDLAKKNGKRYVKLHPDVNAMEYYKKLGYVLVENAGDGKIEYLMVKKV